VTYACLFEGTDENGEEGDSKTIARKSESVKMAVNNGFTETVII
jgi:hypothetical protein